MRKIWTFTAAFVLITTMILSGAPPRATMPTAQLRNPAIRLPQRPSGPVTISVFANPDNSRSLSGGQCVYEEARAKVQYQFPVDGGSSRRCGEKKNHASKRRLSRRIPALGFIRSFLAGRAAEAWPAGCRNSAERSDRQLCAEH